MKQILGFLTLMLPMIASAQVKHDGAGTITDETTSEQRAPARNETPLRINFGDHEDVVFEATKPGDIQVLHSVIEGQKYQLLIRRLEAGVFWEMSRVNRDNNGEFSVVLAAGSSAPPRGTVFKGLDYLSAFAIDTKNPLADIGFDIINPTASLQAIMPTDNVRSFGPEKISPR